MSSFTCSDRQIRAVCHLLCLDTYRLEPDRSPPPTMAGELMLLNWRATNFRYGLPWPTDPGTIAPAPKEPFSLWEALKSARSWLYQTSTDQRFRDDPLHLLLQRHVDLIHARLVEKMPEYEASPGWS